MVQRVEDVPRQEFEQPGQPEILTPVGYAKDFIQRVNREATTEAWLQSMLVTPHAPLVRPMYDGLRSLQQRGGRSRIITDHFSRMRPDDLPAIAIPRFDGKQERARQIVEATQELFALLQEDGGEVHETRPPDSLNWYFPSYGRNHMKSAGVLGNDGTGSVYLGGVNLYQNGMESADFMVRFDDPAMVRAVTGMVEGVLDDSLEDDVFLPVSPDYDVLVDMGRVPGRSLIQQAADTLIQQGDVREICITSQYPLDPHMNTILAEQAKTGVTVNIHTLRNNPGKPRKGIARRLYQDMEECAAVLPTYRIYPSPKRFVHAKLLHTTHTDGRTNALWGSHNYFMAGYFFRTAEMQVRSRNAALNRELYATFWNMVAGSFYP